MGVVCQILLRKTKEGIFRAGQPVGGTLKYFIDKPMKFESIDISLVGKGKCQWSESDGDDTIYYHNKEEYVNACRKLTAKDDKSVLSGAYECPFEFLLPENIPTSMKNKNCTIEYKVNVTFVKKCFFETKFKFDEEVIVYGYVSPCTPEPLIFGLQKKLLSLTSNYMVNVKAEIDRTFVTPGENITLCLTINNDSDVPITIKTELIKYFTYVSDGKRKMIENTPVKTTTEYSPTIKEKSVSRLTCIVPTLPSLYSIQNTKILVGEYKVRVTAELPFPHKNASVEVPVVIGERKDHLGAAVEGYDDGSPSTSEMLEKSVRNEENSKDYFYDNNLQELGFN